MSEPIRRVALLFDDSKPAVMETCRGLRAWLEERVEIVVDESVSKTDMEGVEADLVIILGGDGSILATVRSLGKNQVPVLGVNFGKLGFLTELEAGDLPHRLEPILAGGFRESRRMRLLVRVWRGERVLQEAYALNDVVLSRTHHRMIKVRIWAGEEDITTYGGDGVIVATPVGSTAYSLSAGGPLVHPEMEALVITPICSHTLTSRPLVLPPGRRIRCQLDGGDEVSALSIDGQILIELLSSDHVTCECAHEPARLVDTQGRTAYEVLRTKLHWGIPLT